MMRAIPFSSCGQGMAPGTGVTDGDGWEEIMYAYDADDDLDALDRELLARDIDDINRLPMDQLRVKTFSRLQCGHDGLSRLRLTALREMVSAEQASSVELAFAAAKLQASCFRWVLRGLDTDKAIRKTSIDAGIA